MKIGVISDTHDQIEQIKQAVAYLNDKEVQFVIHCGDWVSPFVLLPLSKLNCPLTGVFGNNDGDRFRHVVLKEKLKLNLELEERFLELNVDHKKIAVFHGDYAAIVEALVNCQKWDVVCHGHTHVTVNEKVGKTLSLNPGSFLKETMPDILGASFAIYDTETDKAEIVKL